tara:strand:- start:624 stop:1424 length:801 start_codon:yes stop_codon:yes gene_type:complete
MQKIKALSNAIKILTTSIIISSTAIAYKGHPNNRIQKPWSVGIAGMFSPNIYKDTEDSYLLLPFISYTGDRFALYGPNAIFKLNNQKYYDISANAYLYSENFKPSDSSDSNLQKLNERKYSMMAGIKLLFKINRSNKINLGIYRSFFGAENGLLVKSTYSFNKMINLKNSIIRISPAIGVEYQNAQLTNYYYGISNSESSISLLPEYNLKSAISPYISFNIMYTLNHQWTIALSSTAKMTPNTIYDSPMVNKRVSISGNAFIAYLF